MACNILFAKLNLVYQTIQEIIFIIYPITGHYLNYLSYYYIINYYII